MPDALNVLEANLTQGSTDRGRSDRGFIACETAAMEDVAARTLGRVAANDIELAYETFGDAGAPPVVLIMGLATQMIAWPDELCEGLAQRGLFVVRFDNRDVGESTHLRNLPPPRLADIVVRRRPPPYSISDMAKDVAGLIDGLGLGEVHLVGASMGGFIAQAVALEHAARRSEEHTSELQSQFHLVCRLLLEKKKKKKRRT